jgi:hypothetical protein
MNLKERKQLILVARSQRNPYLDLLQNTTLVRLTKDLRKFLARYAPGNGSNLLGTYLETSVRCGLLLTLALSCPYDALEVKKIKHDLVSKELHAMESLSRESKIDWDKVLSSTGSSFIPGIYSPNICRSTPHKIQKWLSKYQQKILFPHCGTKLLSKTSQEDLHQNWMTSCEQGFSSTSSEYIYSRTGYNGSGVCEMKQKWYPTQAIPRTYFAQGLDAYNSSKYLRNMFNDLADLFRNVNRFKRVLPQEIIIKEGDDVFIYDLTSFTSLFHEHRAFLLALSRAVGDAEITYFDNFHGLSSCTVSWLIEEYVRVNVSFPGYTTLLLPIDESIELSHGVAGFLGVYGNLITCTIPHGLSLASLNDDFISNWCAGDDAGIAKPRDQVEAVHYMAKILGELAEEKVFVGSEKGAVALKRSISIEQGLLLFKSSVLWPTLALFLCDDDGRFSDKDMNDAKKKFASALVPFLNSLRTVSITLDDQTLLLSLMRKLYGCLRFPLTGWLPILVGFHPWEYTIPIMDEGSWFEDPLIRLAHHFYTSTYNCCVREKKEVDMNDLFTDGMAEGNMTDYLKNLERVGYVYSEEIKEMMYDEYGLLRLEDDLRRRGMKLYTDPKMYRFSLVDTVPLKHQIVS